MHASSLENMRKCRDRYVGPEYLVAPLLIVEIGSQDVNGNYRHLFAGASSYIGIDLAPGPGVDIVLADPYTLPFADGEADIVLSGQMLEHCEFFWMVFAEMARVLKPDGLIFLIAPSAGPIHAYPVDCYRFYPDAFRALAKFASCEVVDIWRDERGPWKDLVGVFSRTTRTRTTCRAAASDLNAPVKPGAPDVERMAGKTH